MCMAITDTHAAGRGEGADHSLGRLCVVLHLGICNTWKYIPTYSSPKFLTVDAGLLARHLCGWFFVSGHLRERHISVHSARVRARCLILRSGMPGGRAPELLFGGDMTFSEVPQGRY